MNVFIGRSSSVSYAFIITTYIFHSSLCLEGQITTAHESRDALIQLFSHLFQSLNMDQCEFNVDQSNLAYGQC